MELGAHPLQGQWKIEEKSDSDMIAGDSFQMDIISAASDLSSLLVEESYVSMIQSSGRALAFLALADIVSAL